MYLVRFFAVQIHQYTIVSCKTRFMKYSRKETQTVKSATEI